MENEIISSVERRLIRHKSTTPFQEQDRKPQRENKKLTLTAHSRINTYKETLRREDQLPKGNSIRDSEAVCIMYERAHRYTQLLTVIEQADSLQEIRDHIDDR